MPHQDEDTASVASLLQNVLASGGDIETCDPADVFTLLPHPGGEQDPPVLLQRASDGAVFAARVSVTACDPPGARASRRPAAALS